MSVLGRIKKREHLIKIVNDTMDEFYYSAPYILEMGPFPPKESHNTEEEYHDWIVMLAEPFMKKVNDITHFIYAEHPHMLDIILPLQTYWIYAHDDKASSNKDLMHKAIMDCYMAFKKHSAVIFDGRTMMRDDIRDEWRSDLSALDKFIALRDSFGK